MKRIAAIFGILLLMCVAGVAQTVEMSRYVSLKVGASFPKAYGDILGERQEFDTGVNVSAAYGMRLRQSVRLELEGSYRKADLGSYVNAGRISSPRGDARVKALMGNVYWDIPLALSVQPYLMGGVGMGRLDLDVVNRQTDHRNDLAYQFGGGFSHNLNDAVALDVGYRYFGMQYPVVNMGIHELFAGLRYGF